MKISELVKKTSVPKETIHFYMREGALPKPRKKGRNTADYAEETVEQIQLIKDLQDNYFLPLSEIKKILKKQRRLSEIDKIKFKFIAKSHWPIDLVSLESIRGADNFMKATGLSTKWLDKMQQWEIITPAKKDGQPLYAPEDVIIGKLVVELDRLGVGPKDGYDPKELKLYIDFVKDVVLPTHMAFFERHLHLLKSQEFQEKGIKLIETIGLFFYHLYRKTIKDEIIRIIDAMDEQKGS